MQMKLANIIYRLFPFYASHQNFLRTILISHILFAHPCILNEQAIKKEALD